MYRKCSQFIHPIHTVFSKTWTIHETMTPSKTISLHLRIITLFHNHRTLNIAVVTCSPSIPYDLMADDEWHQVRRRRNVKPESQVESLRKKLPIPVVPLAFGVLDVEVNEVDAKNKEKKKLKQVQRKETKAKAKPANPATKADADVPKVTSAAPSTPASRLSLAQLFWALIAWLKSFLGLAPANKRKVKKPKPPSAVRVADVPTDSQVEQAASGSRPAPAISSDQLTSTKGSGPSQPKPASAPAAAATPSKSTPPASVKAADANASVVEEADGLAPEQVTGKKKNDISHSNRAEAAAPTKKAAPPPACDSDWARGRFLYVHSEGAHSDVVSSLAMAGDVALSSGYDGAIKVWRWNAGLPLQHVRNLTGHSGRVESVALDPTTALRAASTGRDSSLKVWDLGRDSSSPVASHYVYESVRCMAVDWEGDATAALGCQSGSIPLWDLERGRKLQVLKGHRDEVCALLMGASAGAAGRLVSGCRDAAVHVWDLRAAPAAAKTCSLNGIRGRACSLSAVDNMLYVGDYSSSVKVFDLRLASAGSPTLEPIAALPNMPSFAGDVCPVAALHRAGNAGVLVSSSIGWWTDSRQALEEAPEDVEEPVACLNVHAARTAGTGGGHEYLYTLRLCSGIATCMATSGGRDRMIVGTSGGDLVGLSLIKGAGNKVQGLAEGVSFEEGLPLGVEVLSDDEDDEEDEEEA